MLIKKIYNGTKLFILVILISTMLFSCSSQNAENIREEAVLLYQDEKYQEAIQKFDEALKLCDGEISPFVIDIILYKAECEYRLGNYKNAKALYEVLLATDKKNENYNKMYETCSIYEKIYASKVALDNNDLDTAEKLLNEIRNAGNNFDSDKAFLFNEIILAEKRNLYEDAFSLLNNYLKRYPNDELALKELEFVNTRLMPVIEPTTEAPKESNEANKNSTDKSNKKNDKNSDKKNDKKTDKKSDKNSTKKQTVIE